MIRPLSFVAILLSFSLFSCHQRQPAASANETGIPGRFAYGMTGTYAGHYSKGLITLVINYISGNIASGYDIHKGLRRNLNGQVELKGAQLSFVLKEPGGNPYDGTFFLSLDTATNTISGNWIPTDSTKAHAGPLTLKRADESSFTGYDGSYGGEWRGDLGLLLFHEKGVCTLEYYPIGQDNAQQIVVKGSYEIKSDSVRIDWQRNDHTPKLNMLLLYKKGIEYTDSTSGTAPSLQGSGVKFELNMAG